MNELKIALAQLNCTVGDLAGNARQVADAARKAAARGADLMLTPELALCGYPPEDLLLRPDFYRASRRSIEELASELGRHCPQIAVLVGHAEEHQGRRYNAASLLRDGRIMATYHKHRLPNYEVFDEARYFAVGVDPCVIEIKGVRVGVNICADVWEAGAADAARHAGAQLLVALNASPFHQNKQAQRYQVLGRRIADTGMPVIYTNMVGGQDELVFDGASFALDAAGKLVMQLPQFVPALEIISFKNGRLLPSLIVPEMEIEAATYAALKLGVIDYLGKNRFPGAIVGLSGGVDSALVLCIAADALGPERVRAIMMPSPYTAQMSLDDSRELVKNLGVRYDEIPIEPAMRSFEKLLAKEFAGLAADATEENLQARIRGMILMAISNKTGAIVLTTGNKSEMAVGYATLYGDMAGGFAVIKDIYKTFVYRLCRYRNNLSPVIPENILTRAPSAELKPGQTDQDTLPPYAVLDAIIEAYMERDESPRQILAQGFGEEDVRRVVAMLSRNEYKRRQAPVGIRITRRGFGKDWRYPITSRYRDEW